MCLIFVLMNTIQSKKKKQQNTQNSKTVLI